MTIPILICPNKNITKLNINNFVLYLGILSTINPNKGVQDAEIASGSAVTIPAIELEILNLSYEKSEAESIKGWINPTDKPESISTKNASVLIYFNYPKSIFSTSISSYSSSLELPLLIAYYLLFWSCFNSSFLISHFNIFLNFFS